jgi:hypothetical protein
MYEQWRRVNVVWYNQTYYITSVTQQEADLWIHFVRYSPVRPAPQQQVRFAPLHTVVEFDGTVPILPSPTSTSSSSSTPSGPYDYIYAPPLSRSNNDSHNTRSGREY